MASLGPPQPFYILRGHCSQIHCLTFLSNNARLLTADADGWVVLWSLHTFRPVAVWRAHSNAILGVAGWPTDSQDADHRRIITHGRDNKLYAWQLGACDEASLSTTLPLDGDPAAHRRQPWLIASLDVNALNFCPFAMCTAESVPEERFPDLLVAMPAALDSEAVDVLRLPDGWREYARVKVAGAKTGMAMALALVHTPAGLVMAAGYESGHAVVYRLGSEGEYEVLYAHAAHSQPVLSLAALPGAAPAAFLTTAADSLVVLHPIPQSPQRGEATPLRVVNTYHSGTQCVRMRGDGKLFATAGWDKVARVYSVKTMRELAVLKWHREGCYAVGFGEWLEGTERDEDDGAGKAVTAKAKRERKAKERHWIAVGSKDGKVSLWEVY